MSANSYHIFMFPFSLKAEWNHENIDTMLRNASWERNQFFYEKGDFASNFSEQGYFYDFCSGAMFDDPTSLNRVLATYQLQVRDGSTYTININKHEFLANDDDGNIDLQKTKNVFLADSIILDLGGIILKDDFSNYARKNVPPYTMPTYIKGLLPDSMHDCRWLLDDRMYVVSYLSSHFSSRMRNFGKPGNWLDKERVEWYWYQYVFLDHDGPTCQNEEMFKQLLNRATYTRWSKYGTFFGISRYSFTCLIEYDDIGLLRHTKTMYYRMASLVLAQRVLSLYYSREISEISKELDEDKLSNKQLRKRVNILNRDYLRFVNNIYFREVTPQDQGIELYDLMQEQMSIKRDEEGLSTEVEQLYHYVTMTNDEQRNAETEKLSIIATLFLVPTLLTGIWGMNLNEECDFWYWIFSAAAVVLAVVIIMQLINVKRK